LVPTFNRHVPPAVHDFERLAFLFTLCSVLTSGDGQWSSPPCALKSNIGAGQIHRQRREIRDQQQAGISTVSGEELLARMLTKVDDLCAGRDRLVGEGRRKYPGTNKAIKGPIERRFRWAGLNARDGAREAARRKNGASAHQWRYIGYDDCRSAKGSRLRKSEATVTLQRRVIGASSQGLEPTIWWTIFPDSE
jgi:hypothetical protein